MSEFENRLERVRKIMELRRLQALILRKRENQFYFTGDARTSTLTVIPLYGECFTIAPISEVSDILDQSNIKKVIGVRNEATLFKVMSEELGKTGDIHVVGIEHDYIHAHLFKMFKHQILPEMIVNDATPIMAELRVSKSEQEVEYVTKAAEIADEAMKTAVENIKPGMNEIQAAQRIDNTLCELGSVNHHPSIVLSGKRTSSFFTQSTDRLIAEGTPIVIRITPEYNGYFASLTRTIPQDSSEMAELLELYTSTLQNASKTLRAGMPIADYEFTIEEQLDKAGLRDALIHPLYAGVGLESEEVPLSRESSVVRGAALLNEFKENMCVSLGSGLFFKDFGIQAQDTWLIEENTARKLTNYNQPTK